VLAAAARAHAVTGHFEDALALFRAALERDPDNPTLKINEILALDKLGRHEEGRRRLDSLLNSDIDPASAGLRKAYLSIFPDAERDFPSLLEEGIAHAKAGRFEDAAGKFQIAAILRPQDPTVLHDLGRALYLRAAATLDNPAKKRHLFLSAASFFDRACRLDPDNLSAHKQLGDALFRAGDFAGSLHVSIEIKRLAPNDPHVDQIIHTLRRKLGLR
jgi:Flp pilus assembly protein TadD